MRLPLSLMLLAAPVVAAAQGGTAVVVLRGAIPDSLRTGPAAAVPENFDLRLTVAFDGTRFGMLAEPGEEMLASLGPQLEGIRFHATWRNGVDSMHLGVMLPPEMSAMMGGGTGFRLDLAIPDDSTTAVAVTEKSDSTMAWTDLGQDDTVAGVRCRTWRGTSAADTVDLCMATITEANARTALGAAMDVPMVKAFFAGRDASGRPHPFATGGALPIRMRGAGATRFTLELQQWLPGRADATLLTLPEGLEPFPLQMLPSMDSTQGSTET